LHKINAVTHTHTKKKKRAKWKAIIGPARKLLEITGDYWRLIKKTRVENRPTENLLEISS